MQTIGVGTVANDGTGDTLRAAMGKINTNFSALFERQFWADDAVADGVTDDATAIQGAIDDAEAAGGGHVYLKAGTHKIGTTLSLPSKVVLIGQGSAVTILKAKTALDAAVVQTDDYSTLISSDTWLVASGNKHGFGLKHLTIDGNKANQSSGNGVNFYGKRFLVDDVIITSCKGEGWHSESNYNIPGTPATDGTDMPEGRIDGLYIWQCDSHGFVFRGQHDTLIGSLFVGECGGWGARFETESGSPDRYSGNCDSGHIHAYANTSGGVYIGTNATHQGAFLISESNYGVGIQCDGWQVKIGTVQLYTNNRSTGIYQMIVAGNECQFGKVHSKTAKSTKAHISISGDQNHADITIIGSSTDGASGSIGGLSITGDGNIVTATLDGNTSAGIGVDLDGDGNTLTTQIQDYSATGGIGLRTNQSASHVGNTVTAYVLNCKTGWNNVQSGNINSYNIRIYANAGQTMFSGVGPTATDAVEDWNVRGYDTDTTKSHRSTIRKLTTSTIDLNTTSEQIITETLDEMFGLTPEPEDVKFGLYYTGTNTTFAVQYLKLHSVSSSAIVWRVKLSTAAGGAATANISYEVSL